MVCKTGKTLTFSESEDLLIDLYIMDGMWKANILLHSVKYFSLSELAVKRRESLMIWHSPIMGIFLLYLLTASLAFLVHYPSTKYMSTKSGNE